MSSFKLIVGLGNPGKEYQETKHNVGFMCIDKICQESNITLDKSKFNGLYYQGLLNGTKVIILKPQTYMNLSGECVVKFIKYYNIDIEDILVIFDDMDTPIGKFRLRQKGSSGGQKGMNNIIDHLKTKNICRIKIGIGKNKLYETRDYVLSKFNKDEADEINLAINSSAEAALDFLKDDFITLMNKYNRK